MQETGYNTQGIQGKGLIIRKMRREDAEEAGMLEKEAFSMPWPKEAFAAAADNPQALYLVAEYDGRIIANCGVRNILGEGEITNVAVKQEFRGKGIGRRLLGQLLEAGRQIGITEFTLEVRVSNTAAIALYHSFGFREEGVRSRFYEKPVEDALVMWKR